MLGILIEITSATGHFYTFHPGWLVIPVILGGFGVTLCTLAMLLRKQSGLCSSSSGRSSPARRLANALGLTGSLGWTFTPGWPFGIDNPYLRSLVLGLAGGIIVLLVNAIMRAFYRHRLHVG